MAPDAGAGGEVSNKRLVLLPPGEEIGLTYNSRTTLRVRYETAFNEIVRNAELRFALVATNPGESTAGATLSAASAVTDTSGIARVDLETTAQEARFRVSVDARDAPTKHFYISVSQGGFAQLHVTPEHAGWRPLSGFDRLELRLYAASLLACADLDPDMPRQSAFPTRELDGFGEAVAEFQNVNAGQPHTVVAWGFVPDSAVASAVGCMDLDSAQLPLSRVALTLPVADRALRVPADAPVSSVLDTGLVAAAIAQAGADRAWNQLACDTGPGQLLLDCMLDAANPDSALDCVPTAAADGLARDVAARRGPPGAGGCRTDLDGGGDPSLDRLLTDAITAGGWPAGADRQALRQARADILASLELDSALSLLPPTAARHRLVTARMRAGGGSFEVDLGATSRPLIDQTRVGVVVDGDQLSLAEHGFTLRYGSLAAAAFAALGLVPAGLPADTDAMGSSMVAALADPELDIPGCEVASALVCTAIERAPACLAAACASATPALDQALAAWWRAAQGSGLDLVMSGHGRLHDADGDLTVEAVGTGADGASPGLWNASLRLADGSEVPVLGEF